MKKFIPLILAVAAVLGPLLFAPSCANTTESPTGGKKDTIPPYITDIVPLPGSTGVPVKGATITFTFNEYVVVKEPRNIFLSPPQVKAPKHRLKGKNLVVYFEDNLDSNTTYTLTFTDAIADNNEGNKFPGYTYVFSTGSRIDSMMITGTVENCNTLNPVKGATVLLYRDLTDSAVFLRRPYAAVKTDDWGFFALPFIADTSYRLYAIKDENNNNIYDPDTELIGFVSDTIKPVLVAHDTIKEMLKYDMKDTLSCLERKSEYEIRLFREKPAKQHVVNKVRTADRAGYITFMAPNAWIDSLWIKGYKPDRTISQFNILNDSLEVWLNDRGPVPDTLKLMVNYRKTDSLGRLKAVLEQINLQYPEGKSKSSNRGRRREISHEDTICVMKLSADPKTVEQVGFDLMFNYPIINEKFDSLVFRYVNPRQKEFTGKFSVERDSLNLRHYSIIPGEQLLPGYDYYLKVPQGAFRDINGFYCDSVEVKVTLPKDEKLGSIECEMTGVDRKVIVELLDEKCTKVQRKYIITKDCTLRFPYLNKGKYCLRLTEDRNENSFVDTGSVLERRQPEKVVFYKLNGDKYIEVLEGAEMVQTVNVGELIK
ncbi:MAG: Ig-like domain-containing protein [Bacteroidales bacterium]|nr:Ig-like domain-containing protein [Bacteroidales bacterium]